MKRGWFFSGGLSLALLAGTAPAQQTDYLTEAEVEQVRATQEPNRRIKLFLQFANERLLMFEEALAPPPNQEATHPDELRERINNFIRAVDDTAEALDWALKRGGVNLRKTRGEIEENGDYFLQRLEHIQQDYDVSQEDLRYDLEDAVEATRDLLELAKKVPDEFIPPQVPTGTAEGTREGQTEPGKPTLKRKKHDPPK